MNLRSEVNENKLANFKCISFEVTQLIYKECRSRFKAIRYLLLNAFYIETFSIELTHKDMFYTAVFSWEFVVKTNVGNFKIVLKGNDIEISNDKGIYRFKLEGFGTTDEIHLKEMILFQKDRVVIERFDTHKMDIEIHFKNTGKVFCMEIPIDIDTTYNADFLRGIKSTSTINDLKKFYLKLFYGMQGDYDRKSNFTTLSVWQKLSDYSDYSIKGIKLDQLVLKSGFIQSCQLGNIYFMINSDPVIVILKDGTYTISGLDNVDKCPLNLNETIDSLIERKRKIDS